MKTVGYPFQSPSRPDLTSRILLRLEQPLTATQLSRQLNEPVGRCTDRVSTLTAHGLLQCLNAAARSCRLFWLTRMGKERQDVLRRGNGFAPLSDDLPDVDWELYGSVCFSHRSMVIKTLTEPMQPAQIKRQASFDNPGFRMSANNVRDVIRYLRAKRIVRAVVVKKKAHPLYVLTGKGQQLRKLLLQAEVKA